MDRKKTIALIHLAKKQLNLDDASYEVVLYGATKKSSCADMDNGELARVLVAFNNLGFVKQVKKKGKLVKPDLTKEQKLIFRLWYKLRDLDACDGTTEGLNKFIKKQTCAVNLGEGIDRIEFCRTHDQCYPVVEGLKKWIVKAGGQP